MNRLFFIYWKIINQSRYNDLENSEQTNAIAEITIYFTKVLSAINIIKYIKEFLRNINDY